ncbi:transposase [Brevibacillus invocatus]|uniref:RNA-guided endonuclease InsQ/TnpB family protein n=1 Tax=Brevibacillus invocatus TaxID=173959 RepID=UPI0030B8209A
MRDNYLDKHRKQKGSNRWKKAVNMLAKEYEHIANQRHYNIHTTSRKLIDTYDLIAVEDLEIRGMIQRGDFSKSISDVGWYRIVQCLEYKAKLFGKQIRKVDPKNTSQLCSSCGFLVEKTLQTRTHTCGECGLNLDRDINASINILRRALEG